MLIRRILVKEVPHYPITEGYFLQMGGIICNKLWLPKRRLCFVKMFSKQILQPWDKYEIFMNFQSIVLRIEDHNMQYVIWNLKFYEFVLA